MSMSTNVEALREGYAGIHIIEAMPKYDVVKYESDIIKKVNDTCLEMGYLCKNDKPRYIRLSQELAKNIYDITEDEKERDKLFAYAYRIQVVGRNYGILKGQ